MRMSPWDHRRKWGGEGVLSLLFCGLPGFIRVGWPPRTDLPFCKAIIFWCCCSVKAVKAFKCFKVNSKTTAFSRCPRVCSGAKENGVLGYLKTHLAWLALHSAQQLKQTLWKYYYTSWAFHKTGYKRFLAFSCEHLLEFVRNSTL